MRGLRNRLAGFSRVVRPLLLLLVGLIACSCTPRFATQDDYIKARSAAIGASGATQGAVGKIGEADTKWMTFALPDGSSGSELLVSRPDGYYVVAAEGEKTPGYEGSSAPGKTLEPPRPYGWVFVGVLAAVLGVLIFFSRRNKLVKAITLRIGFSMLSLLFITFVAFVADEVAPGNAATVRAGEKATAEQIQRLEHNMGLDRPWYIRYGEMLGYMAQGDFGRSYYGPREPVTDIIERDLPMTARLAFAAVLLSAGIGILFGTLAAVYQNRFVDRSVLTLGTLGVTIPNFVLGPLLVIVFSKYINDYLYGSFGIGFRDTWSTNRDLPDWTYLVLPVIVLAARPAAMLTRLTRASMIETMQQEFVRLAVAKGVPFWRMVVKHALRNAILPVVTAIGTSFGFLLTGSFVTERFFLLPGLGREAIEAILQTNAPVVQGTIIVTGIMFILVNLIVDLMLPMLDPRIREAQV